MVRELFLVIFLSIIISKSAMSQACCSGGTPLSSNLGIQSLSEKAIQIQLAYDYNTQRDLVVGNEQLDDDSRHRDTHSALFRLSYALSPRWSVTGLFSWIRQEENIFRSSGNIRTAAQGFGDVVALAQYSMLDNLNAGILIAGGTKIPVGVTNRADPRTGILLNPDLQPGTGAWDGLLGIHAFKNHVFSPNFNLLMTATYRITTYDQRFDGRQRYKFGNEWVLLAGVKEQLLIQSLLVNPSLLLKYRITGKDKIENNFVPNTSGHWIHLVPGLDFAISPAWMIGVSAEIPLYRNLDGTQLTTSQRFTLSLNYTLLPSKTEIF